MKSRHENYKAFHAMLNQMGIADAKQHLLESYAVESTRQLSDGELDDLVRRVTEMKRKRFAANPEIRRWRSNILTLLNKYGIYVQNNDWSRVNAFLMQSRIAGKLLFEMDVTEMKALSMKLHSMIEKQHAEKLRTEYLIQCN